MSKAGYEQDCDNFIKKRNIYEIGQGGTLVVFKLIQLTSM